MGMRTSPRRAGPVLVAFAALLVSRRSAAEGDGGRSHRPGTATRVYGASFLKPVAGGIATVGGTSLHYLPPGGGAWDTPLSVDANLYRLGLDDAGGRLLAVWEQQPQLHLLRLRDRRHDTLPLPPLAAPGLAHFLSVHSLAFTPGGWDALVYLTGPSRARRTDSITRAYRLPLGGGGAPALLWEIQNGGDLLWTCGRGALYILPHDPNTKWSWRTDLNGHLAVLDVTGGTVTERNIYDDPA